MNEQLIEAGIARCQWCDHIWEAEVSASPSAARDRPGIAAPRPPAVPTPAPFPQPIQRRWRADRAPRGVRVEEHDQGVTLRIPWRQRAGLLVHGFFLAMTALLLGSLVVEGLEPGLILVLPFVVVYAYMLVNSTVLEVTPEGVAVTNGPLPSPMDPGIEVATRWLERLRVEETFMAVRNRYGTRTQTVSHYTLWAGPKRLMRKFADEEVVLYVAAAIANTVDTAVEIERR